MKKIDANVRGAVQSSEEALARKSARIARNVENAIAFAEDKVDSFKETAEKHLANLGDVADGGQTSACSSVINSYISAVKEMKAWEDTINILKGLKKALNEEVEVEE